MIGNTTIIKILIGPVGLVASVVDQVSTVKDAVNTLLLSSVKNLRNVGNEEKL